MTEDEKLKLGIIKTIAWFDIFDYPMAKEELQRYGLFSNACSLSEIESELSILVTNRDIIESGNFYHLPGREGIVAERKKRFNYADLKFKRAILVSKVFRFVSSVELVALGNLIGSHNLRAKGDIDLLVVVKPGTIWLTRFLLTAIVKLLGVRPSTKKTENTICLSFYTTSGNLNFESIADVDHLYFYYWLAFLTPIFDRSNVYAQIFENNAWLKERLPNFEIILPSSKRTVTAKKFLPFDWLVNAMQPLEYKFKEFELEIMPNELKSMANKDSRVVISDKMLKLHANDRRREFQDKYQDRLKRLNVI